jgi:penicillin amidase
MPKMRRFVLSCVEYALPATWTGHQGAFLTELTDILRERAKAALPPVEGEVRLSGLREPAQVLRDRWGVPHVYAGSVWDLYFAASYVVTSERLFQQDLMLRLANGRLSSMVGDVGLPLDRFFRTIGLNRAAARIASGYDDFSQELIAAAIAGANAWIETMPARPLEYDFVGIDPEPFPAGDEGVRHAAAIVSFMSWMLSTNWDAELLRAEIADTLGWEAMLALFPDASVEPSVVVAGKHGGENERRTALDLLRDAILPPSGVGSNNWAVAGSRTVTGKPLLANDPHLLAQVPSLWFELHLSAPGIDVRGVTLPVLAGVEIGHNDRVAWGFTAVSGDTQDLYLEKLDEQGASALYNGRWEPLAVHREEIPVKGRAEPEILEVRESRHGPLIDAYMIGSVHPEVIEGGVTETYALRWVAHEHGVSPKTLHQMATARDCVEMREALREWHSPGLNMIYADVQGNIAYQCTGLYPIRRRGDGTLPVPGWTDEYDWDGFVPFDELPWALNPAEGLLATANQKIHDDSYPYLIGKDFMPPFRARRIVQLLTTTDRHSKETFARMHSDTMSLAARDILPLLLEVEPADDRQKEALVLLEEWDGDLAADSVPAAIYEVWCKHIAETVLLPKLGRELFDHYYARRQWSLSFQYQVLPNLLRFPTATWFGADGTAARDQALQRAMDGALSELTDRLGPDMAEWAWGNIHRVRLAAQQAVVAQLAELFTVGEAPWGGDEQTICQGLFEPGSGGYDVVVVPSWRQIIDLSDLDASVGTHTVGQSGNPASPHFKDLFPLWSTGQYHPLPFTRPAVEAATESRLRLVPALTK